MVFERVGSTFVLLHTKAAPSDPEWNRYMDAFRALGRDLASMGILVLTDGGGPTSAQRRVMNEIAADAPARVAIVSDAPAVRFIVSTIALFHAHIRTFGVRSLPAALEHVGVRGEHEREVRRTLERLCMEHGSERFTSAALALRGSGST